MFEQTSMELFYIFHVYVGLTLSKLSLSFFFFFQEIKKVQSWKAEKFYLLQWLNSGTITF